MAQCIVPLSVGVFGSNGHLQLIADLLAVQLSFQPGDNPAGSVHVRKWLAAGRRVEDLTIVVGKRVINCNNGVFCDLHRAPYLR